MNYKSHHSGVVILLISFLSFFCQQAIAVHYNEDIRYLLYTLPIIDGYGIAAELNIEEVNHYRQDPETGKITPLVWYEAITRVPHWTKDARYCNYCSEIPLFENLNAHGSTLRVQVKPSSFSSEDKINLEVSSDYSSKEFTTSRTSLPKIPDAQTHIAKQIMTILLGANPIMFREFDTDSYLRWAWVDNVMGSWFEKQPIKTMKHPNQRVLMFNPGDHYRMAIIMDENNEPEAVILDDAQGAFRRKMYNFFSPLYYAANLIELPHHARQSLEFGAGTFLKKGYSYKERLANAGFFAHNLFEFSEHAGHLQVVQKAWHYFGENNSTTIHEDIQKSAEEFEPDYIMAAMDTTFLALTVGEIAYQLPKGYAVLIENSFSLGLGTLNLLVSANGETFVEGFNHRIYDLISKYYKTNQKALYLEHKDKL